MATSMPTVEPTTTTTATSTTTATASAPSSATRSDISHQQQQSTVTDDNGRNITFGTINTSSVPEKSINVSTLISHSKQQHQLQLKLQGTSALINVAPTFNGTCADKCHQTASDIGTSNNNNTITSSASTNCCCDNSNSVVNNNRSDRDLVCDSFQQQQLTMSASTTMVMSTPAPSLASQTIKATTTATATTMYCEHRSKVPVVMNINSRHLVVGSDTSAPINNNRRDQQHNYIGVTKIPLRYNNFNNSDNAVANQQRSSNFSVIKTNAFLNNKANNVQQQASNNNNNNNNNSNGNSNSYKTWNIQASIGARQTINPIREIIEMMDLEPNPDKSMIPLSIGDPTVFGNLQPCDEIIKALHDSVASGKNIGYQTAAGMEAARQAVADYHNQSTGNCVKSKDVILASGCSHALDLAICVLASSGQNILIPKPGFPIYKTLTSVYGVQYKQYDLIAEKDWTIDFAHLESLIDKQTAAIVVNNPSNPCGSVFTRHELMKILHVAEKYCLPIIADEIYDKFVFDDISCDNMNNNDTDDSRDTPRSFIAVSSLTRQVPILTCGGTAKQCLVPGLRLGWVIINDTARVFDASVRACLNRLTQRLMGPSSIAQGALKDILTLVPHSFYANTIEFVKNNALICYNRLRTVPGLHPFMPAGAMYLMCRIDTEYFEPTSFSDDLEFTSKLVHEESVLVLPGKCFDFPNYFRICLTVPVNIMHEAMDRIEAFCQHHLCVKPIDSKSEQLIVCGSQSDIFNHDEYRKATTDSNPKVTQPESATNHQNGNNHTMTIT